MDITSLTFTLKDVITITFGIASLVGIYYKLLKQINDLKNKMQTQETQHNMENAAADKRITDLTKTIDDHKNDSDKREDQVYKRINEIREEQKNAHEKLEFKIDAMANHLSSMNTNLSELTGYIKAKKEN
jgi:predicted Holliday junction resolvase-like endonuclease